MQGSGSWFLEGFHHNREEDIIEESNIVIVIVLFLKNRGCKTNELFKVS